VSDVVKPGQAPCDRDGCTNKATHAYFRCLNHPMPAAPIEKAQPPTNDALRSAYESALEDVPVTITARGRTVRVEASSSGDAGRGGA
jgi:hypothetical protein